MAQGDEYYGFNTPFLGGTQTVMSKQAGLRIIKNDLLQLLLTIPGERVHRPSFGTPIKSLPFEDLTENTLLTVRRETLAIIEREEPRVRVTALTLSGNPDTHEVNIQLSCYLTNDPLVKFEITNAVRLP